MTFDTDILETAVTAFEKPTSIQNLIWSEFYVPHLDST